MNPLPFHPGDVFRVEYPFVRDTYCADVDIESGRDIMATTWRPGTEFVGSQGPDGELTSGAYQAHGMGTMVLTVVSVHKPGRFPTRVFFTREWVNPDGKTFGKRGCRMVTREKFERLSFRYQHDYELAKASA